jgi:methyl-accepting chemotaxis protein
MAIPIFWRLMLLNSGILILSVTACLYSIIQLGSLSHTARTTLDSDQRMIGYQETLTDTFLSEFRYGGKYIITHLEDRYDQMGQFKSDFVRYMREIKSLAQSQETITLLSRIERDHRRYHELLDQEAGYIRANQRYAQSRYQQEREKILESVLGELARLKEQLRTRLQDKLVSMERAADTARGMAMVTTLIVSLLGIFLSLKIGNGITIPLKELKRRTEAVSSKTDHSRWIATQLPEIQELAQAIEQKQQSLRHNAAVNDGLRDQITDELMPQLLSLQNRLERLRRETDGPTSSQVKASINDATKDTERLIEFCLTLSADPGEVRDSASILPQTALAPTDIPTLPDDPKQWLRSILECSVNAVKLHSKPLIQLSRKASMVLSRHLATVKDLTPGKGN